MMLVAIKDTKALAFGRPSLAVNKDVALRDVKSLVNDSAKTLVSQYPGDYELWQVGSYYENTGIIESKLEFIENLGNLKEAE